MNGGVQFFCTGGGFVCVNVCVGGVVARAVAVARGFAVAAEAAVADGAALAVVVATGIVADVGSAGCVVVGAALALGGVVGSSFTTAEDVGGIWFGLLEEAPRRMPTARTTIPPTIAAAINAKFRLRCCC